MQGSSRQLPGIGSGALVLGVAALAAAAVGALAASDPVLALLIVVGAVTVTLIVEDLTMGLFLFVGVSFLEALPKLFPAVSVSKALGLLVVLSWLAAMAVRKQGAPSLLAQRPSLLVMLAVFLAWVGASLLWARQAGPVLTEFSRFLPLFALFPIVCAAVLTRRHVTIMALIVIGGAIVSAVAGIISAPPPDVQGAGRLSGAGVGANALAPVLVSGAVLAAAFVGMKSRTLAFRLAAVAGGCSCIIGVVLTGSRGGLLGFGAALVAGLVFAGRGRRARVVPVVAVAAALTVFYVVALAPTIVRDRISNPGDGSGRSDIWRVGVEMVKANPVLGVGAGNFKARSPEYVLDAGLIRRSDLIVDDPHVTHNIYLQVLSQLGAVGLLLFLAIVASALTAAALAAREFARQHDEQMELIARAVFVGLCGMLTAGFFGSWLFSKPLWLLLALGPAMLALARRPAPQIASPESRILAPGAPARG